MALVLIIENTLELQQEISRVLRQGGHRVFEVANGSFGLRLAELHEPDAIILDMKLPDMSGMQVIKLLREDSILKDIPILAIPGNGAASIDDALTAGADSVLVQPKNGELLLSKLDDAIKTGVTESELEDSLEPPEILREAYGRIARKGKILGDGCEVLQGIAVRDRKHHMAEVMRGPQWQPILTSRDVRPFRAEHSTRYVFYEPRILLRSPDEELLRSEKVILSRVAPPASAAVDREGMLTDISVYNLIPVRGLSCAYIAAVINSRMMDYFISRIRPPKTARGIGSMLRTLDIEEMPLIIPGKRTQSAIEELYREVEANSLSERGSARRDQLVIALNSAVFDVYGFKKQEIEKLTALSF